MSQTFIVETRDGHSPATPASAAVVSVISVSD
jgi:hypothetical protein